MPAQDLVVFDDGVGTWGPLTDLRAVFELRTGAATTLQRIEQALQQRAAALIVPAGLRSVVAERFTSTPVNPDDVAEPCLLVNGRWLGVEHADRLAALEPGTLVWDEQSNAVVAAHGPYTWRDALLAGRAPDDAVVQTLKGRALATRPWHVLDGLEAALRADLARSDAPIATALPHGVLAAGDHPVRLADGVKIAPGVVFNVETGPIVVDVGASVGANSVLEGPCYVGPHCTIVPLSRVRANTVLGPWCKVGGEVSFSIFHGYANKAHAGFLGHALIGAWVNLGAGTCASNLKNTYGPVRVRLEPDQSAEDTGRTFVGPVIGDFVRTAIGSRLPTGACLGTGAMLAVSGFAPAFVDRFAFLTDAGAQRTDPDKFFATVRAMMGRRQLEPSAATAARLRSLMETARVKV